jgi:hypothetical protein
MWLEGGGGLAGLFCGLGCGARRRVGEAESLFCGECVKVGGERSARDGTKACVHCVEDFGSAVVWLLSGPARKAWIK